MKNETGREFNWGFAIMLGSWAMTILIAVVLFASKVGGPV